jgi:hypothetical protein
MRSHRASRGQARLAGAERQRPKILAVGFEEVESLQDGLAHGAVGMQGGMNPRLSGSTNPRENTMTARFRVALRAKSLQARTRHLSALAQTNHVGPAKGGRAEQHGECKQGRQNAASSPSHVNPSRFLKRITCGMGTPGFYQRSRGPATGGDGPALSFFVASALPYLPRHLDFLYPTHVSRHCAAVS